MGGQQQCMCHNRGKSAIKTTTAVLVRQRADRAKISSKGLLNQGEFGKNMKHRYGNVTDRS